MEIVKYQFKCIGDDRGTLVPIEGDKDIPFEIRRIYYMYGTKKDVVRGCHAHKNLEQILICIHGSCTILLDDGVSKEVITLDKKQEGLYIGASIWREMYDFSEDAVLVVLASAYYTEEDYIRSYDRFLESIQNV